MKNPQLTFHHTDIISSIFITYLKNEIKKAILDFLFFFIFSAEKIVIKINDGLSKP